MKVSMTTYESLPQYRPMLDDPFRTHLCPIEKIAELLWLDG